MTRKELLHLLVVRAHANGFAFRQWYRATIDQKWTGMETALNILSTGHRYYALLFSHAFAEAFWKHGEQMQFTVPAREFIRLNNRGETIRVQRKAYTRRTLKPNAWRYHLREMADAEEPLRYIRKFLVTEEELQEQLTENRENLPLFSAYTTRFIAGKKNVSLKQDSRYPPPSHDHPPAASDPSLSG
ncbi:hypothetical protein [Silvibacterium acidisoli]|uniref:hypothetical protein n=1 Tax=Acidobacteriaceae bacterium ZG23-2 TaxID=2883246 RepID=UPI00406C4111